MNLRSKYLVVFGSLMLCALVAVAAPAQYAFRVSFTDKKGSPALSSTPAWLSARSLARRANYGIGLDSTDQLVSPVYIDSVLRLTGGVFHMSSRWLNTCVVLLDDSSKVLLLQGKPWVKKIDWVGYFPTGLHQRLARNDNPKFTQLSQAKATGSASYYGSAYPFISLTNGDYLHDLGYTGTGKLIVVLDEGFFQVNTDAGFAKMRLNGRLLDTYNFVQPTANIFYSGTHGLNCLSIMAGYLPGNYVGTAPDAAYALYATEDANFTDARYELDNLIAGMERADSLGADVISASIVYNTFSSPYSTAFAKTDLDGYSLPVSRAVNMAVAKGIFYTSSAGNEGGNSWDFIDAPADADSAMTVGSVGASKLASAMSSPGPNASGRVKPDVCLLGESVALFAGNGVIGAYNGTSFAAPQVAGYAACLLQAFPKATPYQIREAIIKSADHYTSPNPKLGYGVPDFKKVFHYLEVVAPQIHQNIKVSPNPFEQVLQVQVPNDARDVQFELYDVLGSSLSLQVNRMSQGLYSLRPQEAQQSGVYFLKVAIDGRQETKRLIRP